MMPRVLLLDTGRASETDVIRAMPLLSDEEQVRAGTFRFFKDRRDYVLAHGMLRAMLGKLLGQPAASIEIVADALGKPQLPGGALCFNLSHSDGMVGCAIAPFAVGFDVEAMGDRDDRAIWPRVLHPTELAWLTRQPVPQQAVLFRRFWTLKEATLKATGVALRQDPSEVCYTLDPITLHNDPQVEVTHGNWMFEQQNVGADHIAALAHRGTGRAVWEVTSQYPQP